MCYSDNFAQIDVFYPQLSYEQTVQRAGLQLITLFSEVGGLLGLLLGASVLTVCELIDYIIMSFSKKLADKKLPPSAVSDGKPHLPPAYEK